MGNQDKYNMSLSNNPELERLSARNWRDEGFDEIPKWPEEVRELWAEPIETPKQFETGFEAVMRWRMEIGLDDEIKIPEPNLAGDKDEIAKCSKETQELIELYQRYILKHYDDYRLEWYMPALEAITLWQDKRYGEGIEDYLDLPEADDENGIPKYVRNDKLEDEKCTAGMFSRNDKAEEIFKRQERTDEELQRLAYEVLGRQKKYNMNLANNKKFEKWTKGGWEEAPGYDASLGEPEWPRQLSELWEKEIQTIEDLAVAIPATYKWRVNIGLSEDPERPEKPQLPTVESCPEKTKELARWYEAYIFENYDDIDYKIYKPVLDALLEWADNTYGQPTA